MSVVPNQNAAKRLRLRGAAARESAPLRVYVATVRRLRRAAARSGALSWLERNQHRPLPFYLRTLLAVHDLSDMAALDVAFWPLAAMPRLERLLAARGGAARVFEYGPGASSLWLARRCRSLHVVEHDGDWWRRLAPLLERPGNIEGRLVPPTLRPPGLPPACPSGRHGWAGWDFTAYVQAIRSAPGPFDLIVIDGRARAHCLAEAVRHLDEDGVILLDDAHRPRYGAAIAASGLSSLRCRGLVPTSPLPSELLLLARRPETLAPAEGGLSATCRGPAGAADRAEKWRPRQDSNLRPSA